MATGHDPRTRAPRSRADTIIGTVAIAGRITDLDPNLRRWLTPAVTGVALAPGALTPQPVRVPNVDADRVMKGLVRFVADIPAGTSMTVVWQQDSDELMVDCASIAVSCAPGLVTMSITVSCDQLRAPRRVAVPFAVGRADSPRGLLMSTYTQVDAPPVISAGWSDAIVAFCWESLLELARRISADAGHDTAGQPLIPGSIAAEDALLIVQPMARHDLSALQPNRGLQ